MTLDFSDIVETEYDLDEMAAEEVEKMHPGEEIDEYDFNLSLSGANVNTQQIYVRVTGTVGFWVGKEEVVVEPRLYGSDVLHCTQCGAIPTGGLYQQLTAMEKSNMIYFRWICDSCYSRNYSERQRANDRIWRNLLAGNLKVDRTRSGMPL